MTDHIPSSERLPAVAPDLVLVLWGHGEWQVKSFSERLSAWLGIDPLQARGRSAEHLFADAVPSLLELATEVLERGQDLSDVKIRLFPEQPEFLADIQFAGLTDDYLGRLVRVTLRRETTASRQEIGFRNLVGQSAAMREVFRKIQLYGPSDAAVIITGETGAGKELVAQALHEESTRHSRLFAAINCTAISDQLLESELFGHERGAFTGAVREHRGYFERADGGTLFLDEIGDMPLHTQSKLLRVLEDGKVQRVGSEKSHQVDVRIVGATNVPLEQAVAENRFRADLYHRLAVLRIHIPALRERREDISLLAERFLQHFNSKYNKGVQRFTPEAIRLLQSYLWPGNVRELRNVIERVVVEAETEAIGARAFGEWIQERQQFASAAPPAHAVMDSRPAPADNLPMVIPYQDQDSISPVSVVEADIVASGRGRGIRAELTAEAIRAAYRACGGNLTAAARRLGVHRATLYRHLSRLNLTREQLS
ncbi:sigma-54 specific transcriptional regulator, flagellar regulatory protein A [Malonomonas rubra DSM 5091]|uniref:Sigma-54 specific transcriptional regulator, flagellar regulatory protein A n=1 Tax=Malonomonas rubra DSM 5091 TaxID=1122189 RepID=A0A1M6HZ03_MALRU|nr:sigma-54 dependent transcriptional regulator [Malonomonas rubra]SHJ27466.1 sigma-54 specific transcriptional regulator, flagellar regulatory protein A [Malonomonas rubra DSM 5091]